MSRRSPSDGRNRENKGVRNEREGEKEEKEEKEGMHLLARHSGR